MNIWVFLLFIFSTLIWTVVPITSNLVLIDIDSSLLVGILFFMIIITLNLSGQLVTRYQMVLGQAVRKIGSVLSFALPFYFTVASIILVNRTLSFKAVVSLQYDFWNIVYQPLGFVIGLISTVMILKFLELNRKGSMGEFIHICLT